MALPDQPEYEMQLMNGPAEPVATLQEYHGGIGFMLSQANSECCRCLCCQPNMEWHVFDYSDQYNPANGGQRPRIKMFAQENATCLGRTCSFCSPGCRSSSYTVHAGETAEGAVIMRHEKEATCGQNVIVMFANSGPVRCPCCCCLPYLTTKNAAGEVLGHTRYLCDMCLFVPKFSIENANSEPQYRLRPDTCCIGMCPKCTCCGQGQKCCAIPFFIRDPVTMEKAQGFEGDAAITDLWAGLKRECCTQRNLYGIKYPNGCDADIKSTLMGSALLLDMLFFEQDDR